MVQPGTASADEVTAAITVPWRNSSAVTLSSARCTSKTTDGPTPARAGTSHVARLSALAASGTVKGPAWTVAPELTGRFGGDGADLAGCPQHGLP